MDVRLPDLRFAGSMDPDSLAACAVLLLVTIKWNNVGTLAGPPNLYHHSPTIYCCKEHMGNSWGKSATGGYSHFHFDTRR